jgi:uncharacterized membrane protein
VVLRRRGKRCPSPAASLLRPSRTPSSLMGQEMNRAGSSDESTTLTSLKRNSCLRMKYLLFAVIGLMLAYIIPYDESFLVHPKDPIWQYYQPFKWWLLRHGIAGACALLLGPMQFSDRLRDRFRHLHRVVGRIYLAGVFVAAPLGFYIQYFEERMGDPRSFSIAAAADAALWMITTRIALVFILKGKVQQHRQWMTRSFAVALVFLEVRVIGGLTGREKLDVHANETIVWVCLVFSTFSADLVLQWQQLRSSPQCFSGTGRSPSEGIGAGPICARASKSQIPRELNSGGHHDWTS